MIGLKQVEAKLYKRVFKKNEAFQVLNMEKGRGNGGRFSVFLSFEMTEGRDNARLCART